MLPNSPSHHVCCICKRKLHPNRLSLSNLKRHTDLLYSYTLDERINHFISSLTENGEPARLSQINHHSDRDQSVKCLHCLRSRRPSRNQAASFSSSSSSGTNLKEDADDEGSDDIKVTSTLSSTKNNPARTERTDNTRAE